MRDFFRLPLLLLISVGIIAGCAAPKIVEAPQASSSQTHSPAASTPLAQPESRRALCVIAGCVNFAADLFFDSGKCKLANTRPADPAKLEHLSRMLAGVTVGFKVNGHTDGVGSSKANMRLSLCRANSVATRLRQLFPFAVVVHVGAFGSSAPIADNKNPLGRANNRRVELLVLKYAFYYPNSSACPTSCADQDPARLEELRNSGRNSQSNQVMLNALPTPGTPQSKDSDHPGRKR